MKSILFSLIWTVTASIAHAELRCEFIFASSVGKAISNQQMAALREAALFGLNDFTEEAKKHWTQLPVSQITRQQLISQDRILDRVNSEVGFVNLGIFKVELANEPRIIKFYGIKSIETEKVIFQNLRGNFFAESIGGPKVYSFGELTYSKRPDFIQRNSNTKLYNRFFFIELEHLAPQGGRTLKEIMASSHDWNLSPQVLRQIADGFLQAHAKQYGVNDADFMITPDGKLRWIDGDFWNYQPGNESASRAHQTINRLIWFINEDRKVLSQMLEILPEAIRESKVLTEEDRFHLLQEISRTEP